MPARLVPPLASLAALAMAGASEASAQRPRSSAAAPVTATVVAPAPSVRTTAASVAPIARRGGSASLEVTISLAIAGAADDAHSEVAVRTAALAPLPPTLRLLASVGGGPFFPVGSTPAAGAIDAEPRPVRLRVEGLEAELRAALPLPVAVDIVTRSADAERVHRVTAELRELPALAPGAAPARRERR